MEQKLEVMRSRYQMLIKDRTKSTNAQTVREKDTFTASELFVTGRTMTSMFLKSSWRSLYSSESLTLNATPEVQIEKRFGFASLDL